MHPHDSSEAEPVFSHQMAQPITLLSVLDEPEVWQEKLRPRAMEVQYWLQRRLRPGLQLLPVTPLAAVSTPLLEEASHRLLLLPWSRSRPVRERRSGRDLLTQLLGVSPAELETFVCPQPPITWCFSPAQLSAWTISVTELPHLLTAFPGWERCATRWSQADRQIVILRQPDRVASDQTEHIRKSPIMDPLIQNNDLYLTYLAHVVQAVIRVCWMPALDLPLEEEG